MRRIDSLECIYCRSAESPFAREHVIPEAFGTFGGTTPVLHCVCKRCNNLFSREFEQEVYRGSLDALSRWKFGLKPPESRDRIDGRRVKLEARGGKIDGLRLDPITNDIEAQIVVKRKADGQSVALTLQEFERLTPAEVAELDFHASKIVVWKPEQKQRFITALHRFSPGLIGPVQGESIQLLAGTRLSGEMIVSMDVKLGRAMAKISFNYLAHSMGASFALRSCFDEIRAFILRGILPNTPSGPVIASGMQANAERPRPEKPFHILTLHHQSPAIVYGRVCLFSGHTYHIDLSRNCGAVDAPPLLARGFGHAFSPTEKNVHLIPQAVIDEWNSKATKREDPKER